MTLFGFSVRFVIPLAPARNCIVCVPADIGMNHVPENVFAGSELLLVAVGLYA